MALGLLEADGRRSELHFLHQVGHLPLLRKKLDAMFLE
jgi:hypothetical protein